MNNNSQFSGAGLPADLHRNMPGPAHQAHSYEMNPYQQHQMNQNMRYSMPPHMPSHMYLQQQQQTQYQRDVYYPQPGAFGYSMPGAPPGREQMGRQVMHNRMETQMGNPRQNHVEEYGLARNVPPFHNNARAANWERGMPQTDQMENQMGNQMQQNHVQHRQTYNEQGGPVFQQTHPHQEVHLPPFEALTADNGNHTDPAQVAINSSAPSGDLNFWDDVAGIGEPVGNSENLKYADEMITRHMAKLANEERQLKERERLEKERIEEQNREEQNRIMQQRQEEEQRQEEQRQFQIREAKRLETERKMQDERTAWFNRKQLNPTPEQTAMYTSGQQMTAQRPTQPMMMPQMQQQQYMNYRALYPDPSHQPPVQQQPVPLPKPRGRKPKDPAANVTPKAPKGKRGPRKKAEDPAPVQQVQQMQQPPMHQPPMQQNQYGGQPFGGMSMQYQNHQQMMAARMAQCRMNAQQGFPPMNNLPPYPPQYYQNMNGYQRPQPPVGHLGNLGMTNYSPQSIGEEGMYSAIGSLPPINHLNNAMPTPGMTQPSMIQQTTTSPGNLLTPSTSNSGSIPTSMEQMEQNHTPASSDAHSAFNQSFTSTSSEKMNTIPEIGHYSDCGPATFEPNGPVDHFNMYNPVLPARMEHEVITLDDDDEQVPSASQPPPNMEHRPIPEITFAEHGSNLPGPSGFQNASPVENNAIAAFPIEESQVTPREPDCLPEAPQPVHEEPSRNADSLDNFLEQPLLTYQQTPMETFPLPNTSMTDDFPGEDLFSEFFIGDPMGKGPVFNDAVTVRDATSENTEAIIPVVEHVANVDPVDEVLLSSDENQLTSSLEAQAEGSACEAVKQGSQHDLVNNDSSYQDVNFEDFDGFLNDYNPDELGYSKLNYSSQFDTETEINGTTGIDQAYCSDNLDIQSPALEEPMEVDSTEIVESQQVPQSDPDVNFIDQHAFVAETTVFDEQFNKDDRIAAQPAEVVETPDELFEQQSDIADEQSGMVEEQSEFVEKSAETVEDQTDTVDEQSGIVEKPAEAFEEPFKIAKEQSGQVDEQFEMNDEQAGLVEEQSEVVEESAETVEDQTDTADGQSGIVEKTAEALEEPSEIAEEPSELVEEQAEMIEKPVDTSEKPSDIAEEQSVTVEEKSDESVEDQSKAPEDQVVEKPTEIVENNSAAIDKDQLVEKSAETVEDRSETVDEQIIPSTMEKNVTDKVVKKENMATIKKPDVITTEQVTTNLPADNASKAAEQDTIRPTDVLETVKQKEPALNPAQKAINRKVKYENYVRRHASVTEKREWKKTFTAPTSGTMMYGVLVADLEPVAVKRESSKHPAALKKLSSNCKRLRNMTGERDDNAAVFMKKGKKADDELYLETKVMFDEATTVGEEIYSPTLKEDEFGENMEAEENEQVEPAKDAQPFHLILVANRYKHPIAKRILPPSSTPEDPRLSFVVANEDTHSTKVDGPLIKKELLPDSPLSPDQIEQLENCSPVEIPVNSRPEVSTPQPSVKPEMVAATEEPEMVAANEAPEMVAANEEPEPLAVDASDEKPIVAENQIISPNSIPHIPLPPVSTEDNGFSFIKSEFINSDEEAEALLRAGKEQDPANAEQPISVESFTDSAGSPVMNDAHAVDTNETEEKMGALSLEDVSDEDEESETNSIPPANEDEEELESSDCPEKDSATDSAEENDVQLKNIVADEPEVAVDNDQEPVQPSEKLHEDVNHDASSTHGQKNDDAHVADELDYIPLPADPHPMDTQQGSCVPAQNAVVQAAGFNDALYSDTDDAYHLPNEILDAILRINGVAEEDVAAIIIAKAADTPDPEQVRSIEGIDQGDSIEGNPQEESMVNASEEIQTVDAAQENIMETNENISRLDADQSTSIPEAVEPESIPQSPAPAELETDQEDVAIEDHQADSLPEADQKESSVDAIQEDSITDHHYPESVQEESIPEEGPNSSIVDTTPEDSAMDADQAVAFPELEDEEAEVEQEESILHVAQGDSLADAFQAGSTTQTDQKEVDQDDIKEADEPEALLETDPQESIRQTDEAEPRVETVLEAVDEAELIVDTVQENSTTDVHHTVSLPETNQRESIMETLQEDVTKEAEPGTVVRTFQQEGISESDPAKSNQEPAQKNLTTEDHHTALLPETNQTQPAMDILQEDATMEAEPESVVETIDQEVISEPDPEELVHKTIRDAHQEEPMPAAESTPEDAKPEPEEDNSEVDAEGENAIVVPDQLIAETIAADALEDNQESANVVDRIESVADTDADSTPDDDQAEPIKSCAVPEDIETVQKGAEVPIENAENDNAPVENDPEEDVAGIPLPPATDIENNRGEATEPDATMTSQETPDEEDRNLPVDSETSVGDEAVEQLSENKPSVAGDVDNSAEADELEDTNENPEDSNGKMVVDREGLERKVLEDDDTLLDSAVKEESLQETSASGASTSDVVEIGHGQSSKLRRAAASVSIVESDKEDAADSAPENNDDLLSESPTEQSVVQHQQNVEEDDNSEDLDVVKETLENLLSIVCAQCDQISTDAVLPIEVDDAANSIPENAQADSLHDDVLTDAEHSMDYLLNGATCDMEYFDESIAEEYLAADKSDEIEEADEGVEEEEGCVEDDDEYLNRRLSNKTERPWMALHKQQRKEDMAERARLRRIHHEREKELAEEENKPPEPSASPVEDAMEFMLRAVEEDEIRERILLESVQAATERIGHNANDDKNDKELEQKKQAEINDAQIAARLGFSPMGVFANFESTTYFFSNAATAMIQRMMSNFPSHPKLVTEESEKESSLKKQRSADHGGCIPPSAKHFMLFCRRARKAEQLVAGKCDPLFADETLAVFHHASKTPIANHELGALVLNKEMGDEGRSWHLRGCIKEDKMTKYHLLYLFIAILGFAQVDKGFSHKDFAAILFECGYHLCRLGAFGNVHNVGIRLLLAQNVLERIPGMPPPNSIVTKSMSVFRDLRRGLKLVGRGVSVATIKWFFIAVTNAEKSQFDRLKLRMNVNEDFGTPETLSDAEDVEKQNDEHNSKFFSDKVRDMIKAGSTETEYDYYDEYEDARMTTVIPPRYKYFFENNRVPPVTKPYLMMNTRDRDWIVTFDLRVMRDQMLRELKQVAESANMSIDELGETTDNPRHSLIYEDYSRQMLSASQLATRQRNRYGAAKAIKMATEEAVQAPPPPAPRRGRKRAAPAEEKPGPPAKQRKPRQPRQPKQSASRPQQPEPENELTQEITSRSGRKRVVMQTWVSTRVKRGQQEMDTTGTDETCQEPPAKRGRGRGGRKPKVVQLPEESLPTTSSSLPSTSDLLPSTSNAVSSAASPSTSDSVLPVTSLPSTSSSIAFTSDEQPTITLSQKRIKVPFTKRFHVFSPAGVRAEKTNQRHTMIKGKAFYALEYSPSCFYFFTVGIASRVATMSRYASYLDYDFKKPIGDSQSKIPFISLLDMENVIATAVHPYKRRLMDFLDAVKAKIVLEKVETVEAPIPKPEVPVVKRGRKRGSTMHFDKSGNCTIKPPKK